MASVYSINNINLALVVITTKYFSDNKINPTKRLTECEQPFNTIDYY